MLPFTYVATSEVSALKHEVGDDTVEGRSLVALTLGFQAQLTEVLDRLGNIGVEELEVDPTGLICIDPTISIAEHMRGGESWSGNVIPCLTWFPIVPLLVSSGPVHLTSKKTLTTIFAGVEWNLRDELNWLMDLMMDGRG